MTSPTWDETQPVSVTQAPASAPATGETPTWDSTQDLQNVYGTPGQMALTAAEGAAKGFLGPVATIGEKILHKAGVPGLSPEEQEGREAANPITHGGAEALGFGAGALTGTGEAAALDALGHAAVPIAAVAGIGGKGAGMLGKIGSSVVRGAVENMGFQGLDETSRYINDPKSVQSAIPHVGLAGLVGGAFGGIGGGVSTLWRETLGTRAGSLLNTIADRAGGIEGAESNAAEKAIAKTAMDVPPELQAAMSSDPVIREQFAILNQSDTTNSGREFQKTMQDFRDSSGKALSESLGRPVESIPDEFDKYTHGKNIGLTLGDEIEARVSPLKSQYEDYAHKYAGKELEPSLLDKAEAAPKELAEAQKSLEKATRAAQRAQAAGEPGAAIEAAARVEEAQSRLIEAEARIKAPGTTDILAQKIGQMALDRDWMTSPSSDIMREVNRVISELPLQKTLKNLSGFIKQMPYKTPMDAGAIAFNRAVGDMKSLLREAESDLIGGHIGSEEGAHVLESYRQTQKFYGAESKIRERLEDRLGRLGTTSGYGKEIKKLAQTDGEAIFRKLSGKDDAELLSFLDIHFPKTAEALRQAHLDQLLVKAKVGDKIDPYRLGNGLKKLSPQLKGFVIPAKSADRVNAISWALDRLKDTHYNYSSTGRTLDKLFQYVPGTAIGMATMLTGHNPAMALLLGGLTKYVSKDAPDAVRLGLLKWLGSNKPIEPGAFKSMVDLIHSTMKGEALTSRATRAVFSGMTKVIPEHLMVTPQERDHLDKKVKQIQMSPEHLEHAGSLPSYYLPNHGISMTETAANAIGYLNSIRPGTTKRAPLDPTLKPTPTQVAEYHRALEIAQQPLTVLQSMKDGQLTGKDIGHLRALYPAYYERLSASLHDEMATAVSRGDELPYRLKRGLSTFFGQPLESTNEPQIIQANRAVFAQATQQHNAQQAQMVNGPKVSKVGMRELGMAGRMRMEPNDNT